MASMSIADFAKQHKVTPRRARRIARNLELGVGKGSKYKLTAAQQRKVEAQLAEQGD